MPKQVRVRTAQDARAGQEPPSTCRLADSCPNGSGELGRQDASRDCLSLYYLFLIVHGMKAILAHLLSLGALV